MVGAFFENMNGETEMKTNCPLGLVGQSREMLVRESSGSRFGIRGSHTSEARVTYLFCHPGGVSSIIASPLRRGADEARIRCDD